MSMVVKQIYTIDNQTQLLINLPENFRKKKRLMVVLDDSVDLISEKKELMKSASNDPLFIADIIEVNNDFRHTDSENV